MIGRNTYQLTCLSPATWKVAKSNSKLFKHVKSIFSNWFKIKILKPMMISKRHFYPYMKLSNVVRVGVLHLLTSMSKVLLWSKITSIDPAVQWFNHDLIEYEGMKYTLLQKKCTYKIINFSWWPWVRVDDAWWRKWQLWGIEFCREVSYYKVNKDYDKNNFLWASVIHGLKGTFLLEKSCIMKQNHPG